MAVLVYFEKFSLKNSNSFFRFFLKVINNKIKNNHQLLLNRDKTLKKTKKILRFEFLQELVSLHSVLTLKVNDKYKMTIIFKITRQQNKQFN